MSTELALLLVDDDEAFRETLSLRLARTFPRISTADSARACIEAIRAAQPDVVLVDLHLGNDDGLELLERIAEAAPGTERIVVTGFGTVDAAVEAMRRGAFDFVTKPLNLEALVQTIHRAAERRDLLRENVGLRRMLDRAPSPTIIGASAAIEEVRELARRAGESDAPVLITGPSGSGKELVARMIHAHSERASRELITVNSAALHENTLESELFGHEQGAFTGATERHIGLVEAAHGSTLFLDEIGELPLSLQAKLLRVVQFGEFRRLGGVTNLLANVRFVTATNRDLSKAVQAGTFREDLYFRLNVIVIRVPSLAERTEDIEPIFRHIAGREGVSFAWEPAHFDALRSYAWPGNVREIENLVQRLRIRRADGCPDPDRLLALLGSGGAPNRSQRLVTIAEAERDAIDAALRFHDGDREAAARTLGVSVRKLYYRIAQYRETDD